MFPEQNTAEGGHKASPFSSAVTQHRDSDESFPKLGEGGKFYLEVNGRDDLIRGAAFTPGLLFKNDPERDGTLRRFAEDLGLNRLRWERRFADEERLQLAEREGMRVTIGWTARVWESWGQWDAEDHRVAHKPMQSQIGNLPSRRCRGFDPYGKGGFTSSPLPTRRRATPSC